MVIAALPKALGQHAVLTLPRYNYVVTRSRPYPLKVLAVSGWRMGTQAECFASIHSVLDSALNAVIYPVLSRLALTLQFYLNTYESESAPVARVALPGGRSNAAPPYWVRFTTR